MQGEKFRGPRLLLLIVVLIAYGSLYPWHLRTIPPDENPLWAVMHSWPRRMGLASLRDVAVNVLVYLPLGFFAFSTLAERWMMRVAVSASLLLGFVLSSLVEISQVFIVGRVPSLLDVTANTVGTAFGIIAGVLWSRKRGRPLHRPDAEFLLCLWVLSQCFPFIPHLGGTGFTVRSSADEVLLSFAQALSLVPVVGSIRLTHRRSRIMLGILLLLVPLRGFIYTRDVTLAEIICAAVVFAIAWFVPVRATVVAPVLALAIAVHGLAPFHFLASPHTFYWVPFQASFYSDWMLAMTIMLGKVFAYGTLVWLLRELRVRLAVATALTAGFLASIEAIQMYLPGRSSEIVDPLIAVILGWVFSSLGDTGSS